VTTQPTPAPRMLVVEDDPDVRSRVARELHLMGRVQIDVAGDGTTGLRKALGDVPHDLILLDLVLPDLSGLLILRALRASGRDTPVLVISGTANPNDLVAAADDERVSFLPKPFEMVALDAWIQRVLRQTPPTSIAGRPGNGRAALGVHRVGNLRIDAHGSATRRRSTPTCWPTRSGANARAAVVTRSTRSSPACARRSTAPTSPRC
jgi:DNA-binding response OmpR family regulator